jgi:hypothetical protein
VDILRAAAEWDAICNRSGGTPAALILLTLLTTGNRPTALFAANVEDLEHTSRGTHIRLPAPKGKKFNGFAAITPELAAMLTSDLKRRNAQLGEPLFAAPNGGRLDTGNVFKRVFLPAQCLAIVKRNWPGEKGCDPAEVAFGIARGVLRGIDGVRPSSELKQRRRALRMALAFKLIEQLRPVVERVRRGRTIAAKGRVPEAIAHLT